MPVINLIDGEKGGVGKSWVARTIIQYLIDKAIPYASIEADRSNPTVMNIYKDSRPSFFSENEKFSDSPDPIFDQAIQKTVVVNLPAQAHRAVSAWIQTKGLIDLGKIHNVSFVKWFISDGEDDSIELFIESLKYYKDSISHVFVKNFGRCDDWSYFEANELGQKAIADHKVKVIDFPKLPDGRRIEINAKRMTFDAARNYDKFTMIGRNQVETYMRKVYEVFDSTGLFTIPTAKVKA